MPCYSSFSKPRTQGVQHAILATASQQYQTLSWSRTSITNASSTRNHFLKVERKSAFGQAISDEDIRDNIETHRNREQCFSRNPTYPPFGLLISTMKSVKAHPHFFPRDIIFANKINYSRQKPTKVRYNSLVCRDLPMNPKIAIIWGQT
jgi:hypothetical protein